MQWRDQQEARLEYDQCLCGILFAYERRMASWSPGRAVFFAALFDTSFTEFVIPKIIRVLYIIGIAISAIAVLLMIAAGFGNGAGHGILALILSPIAFLLLVIGYRIYLEVVIVLFRIAENTRR